MAGTLTLSSTTIAWQVGQLIVQGVTYNLPNGVLQVNSVVFGSGTFISTTGPSGAVVCLISPPAANAVQLTLKGVTGDTGIPITPNNVTPIPFFSTAGTNTIGLTSASAITGNVYLVWLG